MHVTHDSVAAHLRDQLQRLAQLLVGSALRDDGRVGVHVAQVRQLVVLRQPPQPVKQLRCPAGPQLLLSARKALIRSLHEQ